MAVKSKYASAKRAAGTAAPAAQGNTATNQAGDVAVAAAVQETETMDTINTAADTATNKAETVMSDMGAHSRDAMAKGTRMFDEMNGFSKGNVEALVESSKIAVQGFEKLGRDAADYTRRSFEGATAAFRSMASVKSPTELFRLQGDYMRGAFDAMVAELSKTSETVLKLAGEVAQPISSRVALAADKLKVQA